ncbi:hypothetical protein FQA47_016170 [Oryzias melastigma]|uniref:Uncharacterized protein n=1 Tax=Oryzias melastigma TaxID=30732 RepID=A0A834L3F3_ORYME|nr:hypothetical protein FQA47_016170 [Oryzias melastigma]
MEPGDLAEPRKCGSGRMLSLGCDLLPGHVKKLLTSGSVLWSKRRIRPILSRFSSLRLLRSSCS